jgi:hypothetical protein
VPSFQKPFFDPWNRPLLDWLQNEYTGYWHVTVIAENDVTYLRYEVEDVNVAILLKLKY